MSSLLAQCIHSYHFNATRRFQIFTRHKMNPTFKRLTQHFNRKTKSLASFVVCRTLFSTFCRYTEFNEIFIVIWPAAADYRALRVNLPTEANLFFRKLDTIIFICTAWFISPWYCHSPVSVSRYFFFSLLLCQVQIGCPDYKTLCKMLFSVREKGVLWRHLTTVYPLQT